MSALTVWRFDTTEGAEQASANLRDLTGAGRLVLEDAATVVWEPGRSKPHTRQLTGASTGDTPTVATGTRALGAGFWGLLFGLIFSMPLLGAAIGAATGSLAGALTDVGIDDGFINRVRDQVTPGTSALFVMMSTDVVDRVHDAFADGPRAELISTDLTPEQEAALREVFAD